MELRKFIVMFLGLPIGVALEKLANLTAPSAGSICLVDVLLVWLSWIFLIQLIITINDIAKGSDLDGR